MATMRAPASQGLSKNIRFGIAVLLAGLAVGIWWFELNKVIGWPGLEWANRDPWSIYVFALFLGLGMVVCAGAPIAQTRARRLGSQIAFVAITFVLSIVCFEFARVGVVMLYGYGYSTWLEPILSIRYIGLFFLPFCFLLFSGVS